jgi:hypothetical protein
MFFDINRRKDTLGFMLTIYLDARNIFDHKAVNSSRNDIFTSHLISFSVLLSTAGLQEENMSSWRSDKHFLSSYLISGFCLISINRVSEAGLWLKVWHEVTGIVCFHEQRFNRPLRNNRCVLIAISRLSIEAVALSFRISLNVHNAHWQNGWKNKLLRFSRDGVCSMDIRNWLT